MAKAPAPARRSWLGILLVFAILTGLGVGGFGGYMYWRHVIYDPGPDLDRKHILGVIAEESPVYFRDGGTRLGAFFQDEHRQQVLWGDLPVAWQASIVASEDERFWTHPGFDAFGIARAVRDNLRAGTMVAGGSTLTQQTAKNLYYRPDRSLQAKLVEALNALRLERHFSKADILTFYANQFHVAGNGRGLGIAALHFFDKDASNLGTLECAFLAGLVKAPAAYDPFTGDAAKRAAAVQRAHDRTRYVLQRLVETSPEDLAGPPNADGVELDAAGYGARMAQVRQIKADAQKALEQGFELPFKRGAFRFDSSAVLDEVTRRLAEPPFAEVLKQAGIDDPGKAGLKVITTLDKDAQRSAIYGLWHHLSEVGIMLEGRTAADFVRSDARPQPMDIGERLEPMEFRYATVVGVEDQKGKKELVVDLGGKACRIDRDGLIRAAAAVHRAKVKSSSAKVNTGEVDAFTASFKKGAVIWVSVRTVSAEGALCDLEYRPELQGSVLVVEDGEVRAMIGGNDNRNFNRATALRQFGSTWKSLILYAAMELGWSPTDVLDNRRNVFPYSTTWYYPRPDHSPIDEVSLAWAGVTSENLASVWLLYHLTDRLDSAHLAELARTTGLARGDRESEDAWRARMQKLGIVFSPARSEEATFMAARREVTQTLAASPHADDAAELASMYYGLGFAEEAKKTSDAARLAALDLSWLRLRDLRELCVAQHRALSATWMSGVVDAGAAPDLKLKQVGDNVRVTCGRAPDGWVPVASFAPSAGADGSPGSWPTLAAEPDLMFDARLHLSTLDALRSAVERHTLEKELASEGPKASASPYDHQDLRVLMTLRYVEALARKLGVQTPIKEVLSMPLGASEITLEEAVKVYEGLVTGNGWKFPGEAVGPGGVIQVGQPAASTLLIREIRDVTDRVIYRAKPTSEPIGTPDAHAMTADVLRKVVDFGTAKRGKGFVTLGGAPLPFGGKTGTTNDFRNVAFLGFVTEAQRAGVDLAASWTVGVYVGYDDNRPMTAGGIKLAGASGALPAWLYTVRGLADAGLLGDVSAKAPEGGWKVVDPAGCTRVHVAEFGGLPAGPDVPGGELLVRKAPDVQVETSLAQADPRPARIAPGTQDAAGIAAERTKSAAEGGGLWESFKKKQAAKEAKPPSPPQPPKPP